MSTLLTSKQVTIHLDDRWPRILWYQSPDGKTRLPGEREAVAPRLYVFRASDQAELSTDDEAVAAEYALSATESEAIYRARITCDGRLAAELDIAIRLDGADATISIENVREHPGYSFLSARFRRVIAAGSCDEDARLVTCGWQGRLLDPRKCKPAMTDYSWHTSIARPCGAAYRRRFMVTIDVPGYEDLFIQEVRQDALVGSGETLASLGAELMYRQRTVCDPSNHPDGLEKFPYLGRLDEPVLCAKSKEMRLHFIRGKTALDWTDAARYFQSLMPTGVNPSQLYDDTVVYKCQMAQLRKAQLTFEEALDAIRKIHNITDGMKQVCYLAFFMHEGGDSGHPLEHSIYPPVGDRKRLRRVMEGAKEYNAIVSFHDNLTQADVNGPHFDPDMACRDALGRIWNAGLWSDGVGEGVQLTQTSMPHWLGRLKKIVVRTVREFGIRTTYHLDTLSCIPFVYDAHPRRPFNATQYIQAIWALLEEFNRLGIDVTSEGLTDAFIGRIGHSYAHVGWPTIFAKVWEGEEAVPFANFIYHGTASWNSGRGVSESSILEGLIQGGGASFEYPVEKFPMLHNSQDDIIDALYLLQPPYAMLRQRKWTGCRREGSVQRVDYAAARPGKAAARSYIEVDATKPGYRVVVDGLLVAKDFATVFPGPRPGTFLAYSRNDCELDWEAPDGWNAGPVPAVKLVESGPGVAVPARIEKGRLKLPLRAHQPVRLGPVK